MKQGPGGEEQISRGVAGDCEGPTEPHARATRTLHLHCRSLHWARRAAGQERTGASGRCWPRGAALGLSQSSEMRRVPPDLGGGGNGRGGSAGPALEAQW
ncbi:hypothetical protein NDU88_007812 [Pleurodeles waltl]|uniref:Uncharacterized protein n=1 Tax=Pleurodeles waltl TaxID=8319 RepID=A0AAV7RQI1_PLEWA|nr:hypothetical protein NDU88_007812 [Pleurodeles waltl]